MSSYKSKLATKKFQTNYSNGFNNKKELNGVINDFFFFFAFSPRFPFLFFVFRQIKFVVSDGLCVCVCGPVEKETYQSL